MEALDPLLPLKKLKHAAFLGSRRLGRMRRTALDAVYRRYDAAVPYRFDVDRHRSRRGELPRMYFLHRDPPPPQDGTHALRDAPRTMYLLWTGDNDIPPARRAGIESLREANHDLDVRLITPDSLSDVTVPEHPFHDAYQDLSFVHRSDYLRAYLMHHHGGAYSDIKLSGGGYAPAIERLNSDPEAWMIGYREVSSALVGGRDARLGPELRRRYRSIAGGSGFAFRPGTALTGEWLREIERRLSYYAEDLSQHPGDALGTTPGYPIPWIEIGMDILFPLQLKHLSHIRYDDSLRPQMTGHR